MPHYPPPYSRSHGHPPPRVNGLLDPDQPDPDPTWPRTRLPPSLLAAVEQWGQSPEAQMDPLLRQQEMNRQRAMAGDPNYASIGPRESQHSGPGRILDNIRYVVPRAVGDFAEGFYTETPRGALDLARTLGAESVGGPGGWITDIIDSPSSPRAPETRAGQAGGMFGLLASEIAGGLGADAAAAVRGVRELRDPEGSRNLGLLELASAVPGFGMAAIPAVKAARAARGLEAMSTSRLEGAISDVMPAEGTGREWMGLLYRTEDVTPKPPTTPFPENYPVHDPRAPRQLEQRPREFAAGEGEWTGIRGLLSENPDRVFTRDELLRHMDEHGVKLKETWRGDQAPEEALGGFTQVDQPVISETPDRLVEAHGMPVSRWRAGNNIHSIYEYPDGTFSVDSHSAGGGNIADGLASFTEAAAAAAEEASSFGATLGVGRPKFSGTRIEGPHENYRELTIQLDTPEGRPQWQRSQGPEGVTLTTDKWNSDRLKIVGMSNGKWKVESPSGITELFNTEVDAIAHADDLWRRMTPAGKASPGFTQGHYPEPNVIVHLRMSDRTYLNPATGKTEKVLFLEEIQSDWHQKGRKYGYRPSADEIRALEVESEEIRLQLHAYDDVTNPDAVALRTRYHELQKIIQEGGIPDAPFKPTGEWTELALRRAMQEAVDGGYDRVAWASGEQAAELYDLRQHVSRIEYNPVTETLEAWDLNGERVINERKITPEQLPEYIGKEPAQRLMDADVSDVDDYVITEQTHFTTREPFFSVEGPNAGTDRGTREAAEQAAKQFAETRYIEGEDLAVGGEGMMGYYDDIVPRTARKYGKQVGGIEIEGIAIGAEVPRPDEWYVGYRDAADEGPFFAREDAQEWLDSHPGGKYDEGMIGNYATDDFDAAMSTNSSFAVTPEMRRIVGEGDQRLWGVGGIGLLGASAAARQRDEEPGLGGGLLAPYTGLLAEIGRE